MGFVRNVSGQGHPECHALKAARPVVRAKASILLQLVDSVNSRSYSRHWKTGLQ